MLRLSDGKLTWGERDHFAMAEILGAESAVRGRAPYQDTIVKLALRHGLRVSDRCAERLERATGLRHALRALRTADDAPRINGYDPKILKRLFKHQRVALSYMQRLPAYLIADAPGVGKTPVSILWTIKQMMQLDMRRVRRVLIITNNNAKVQWRREIRRWSPVNWPVHIIRGTIREQRQLAGIGMGWVIGHWESLVHAERGYLRNPWDAVILDEAHKMNNRKAQRSETARALDTELRLALTGHPYANSPEELYAILNFLYPEEYSAFWRFFNMHVKAEPKAFGGYEVLGVRRPKLLRWELAPFTIRRTKRQVFPSLPAITRTERTVELTKRGASEYEKLKRQFFVELASAEPDRKKIIPIPSILARTIRLRQYLIDPALLGAAEKSVKYPAVSDLLEELDRPAVIFTSFRQAAIRLQDFLHEEQYVTRLIAGGMTDAKKEKRKKRFLRGDLDALVVVGQAGGESLNLGKYGYVIFLDLPLTARDLEQWEGRVDRPEEGSGKLVPTTAYRVIVENSYEERLETMLEKKHAMFQEGFNRARLEALFK